MVAAAAVNTTCLKTKVLSEKKQYLLWCIDCECLVLQLLLENPASGRVVVLMGSTSDMVHCDKIRKACGSYGVPCVLRVTSAHKGPDETLRIKAEYEGVSLKLLATGIGINMFHVTHIYTLCFDYKESAAGTSYCWASLGEFCRQCSTAIVGLH